MKSVAARIVKMTVSTATWERITASLKSFNQTFAASPAARWPSIWLENIPAAFGENVSTKSFFLIAIATVVSLSKDLWLGSGSIGLTAFLIDVSTFLVWEVMNVLVDWKDLQTKAVFERLRLNRASWADPGLRELMDREEMGYFSNNIAIGSNMLISTAVDAAHGWASKDVRIELTGGSFAADYHDTPAFLELVDKIERHPRQSNKPRVMLMQYPVVGTDRTQLVLECTRTDWATFRYPRTRTDWEKIRSDVAEEYFRDKVHVSNSLTLHLIIKTSDNKYVLAKVSRGNSGDRPGWALTIGEQFDPGDIAPDQDSVRRCVVRALREELGVVETAESPKPVLESDLRVMALNFEYLPCNFTLITIAKLTWTFADVLKSFTALERMPMDREASALKGIDPSELAGLVQQTADLHFSTPIRAACAMIYEGRISDLLKLQQKPAPSGDP